MKYLRKLMIGVVLFVLCLVNVHALDVSIDSVSIKEKSDDIEVSAPTTDGQNIDSTIKFKELNDYVTFEVKLNSDQNHVISSVTDNNDNDYIKTSYTYDGLKFYMTLKYKTELTGTLDLEDIEITVNFSDGTSTKVNPKTFDSIIKSLIELIVSVFGLVIGFKLFKKQFRLAAVILMLVPVMIFAEEALNSVYTFKVENVSIAKKYTITYEANGGTGIPENKVIFEGEKIGGLPIPDRENYVLDGWYLEPTFGTKIDSNYEPQGSISIYAKWLKSVKGATVSPTEINIEVGQTATITVSNVEEEYSFSSGNTGTASVDSNGVVTGAAAGTTTITIKGESSEETKTVSVTVTEPAAPTDPVSITDQKVNSRLSLGDKVQIGGQEFYVVDSNGDTTSLLAKYNLKVGDNYTYNGGATYTKDSTIAVSEDGYGLQSSTTKGYVSGGAGAKYLGAVAFSGTNYWDNKHCDWDVTDYNCSSAASSLASGFSGNYNGIPSVNVYRSNMNSTAPVYEFHQNGFGLAQSNGYTIAYFVEAYVSKLKELGAPSTITGRLLLTEEAQALGCSLNDYECLEPEYDWVYSSSYWTGSASAYGIVRFINSIGMFETVNFAHSYGLGVRPVIVINTEDLLEDNQHIVKFNANGGSVNPSYVIVPNGNSVGTLPTPTSSDSTQEFQGWFTLVDGGIEVTSSYEPTGNVEIFAHWNTTAAPTPTSAFNFEYQKTSGTISVGDELSLDSEKFYVVSSDNENTVLISKYNLYVGDVIRYTGTSYSKYSGITSSTSGYGLQNQNAKGFVTSPGSADYVGVVAFSGTNYWNGNTCVYNDMFLDVGCSSNANALSDGYTGTYNGNPRPYIYRLKVNDVNPIAPVYDYDEYGYGVITNQGYRISYYVENYINTLKTLGAPDTISGRLLKYEEAIGLGCDQYECIDAPAWLSASSYWIGTAKDYNKVYNIDVNYQLNQDYFYSQKAYGVRPVIVVNTDDIDA